MIRKQKVITWLQLCFWLGAGIDFTVGLGMIFPPLGRLIFGLNNNSLDPGFRYAMGLGAALMFGWTILLLWADQDPLNRKGVLLITVFPVIIGIAGATVYGFFTGLIPVRKAFSTWTFQILLSFFLMGSYLNAVRYQREQQSPPPGPYNPSWEKK